MRYYKYGDKIVGFSLMASLVMASFKLNDAFIVMGETSSKAAGNGKKSDVWEYYEKSKDAPKARCTLCNKELSYCGGTYNKSLYPFRMQTFFAVNSRGEKTYLQSSSK